MGTVGNGAVLLLVERLGCILLPLLMKPLIKGELFPIAVSEEEVEVEAEVDSKSEAAALAIALVLAMLTVHIFLIIFTAATPFDTLRAAYNHLQVNRQI
jgi:hypothetical protein